MRWDPRFLSTAGANPGGRGDDPSWKPHDAWPTILLPQLALKNALRYFPLDVQELLAPEFAQELRLYGHIYMYRFCPDIKMR